MLDLSQVFVLDCFEVKFQSNKWFVSSDVIILVDSPLCSKQLQPLPELPQESITTGIQPDSEFGRFLSFRRMLLLCRNLSAIDRWSLWYVWASGFLLFFVPDPVVPTSTVLTIRYLIFKASGWSEVISAIVQLC